MAAFTHTILRACASVDDEEDLGPIDVSAALQLVAEFAFADELAKREKDPELTVPTLTFRRSSDGCYFVVWSDTAGEYVLYCPTYEWLLEGATETADVQACLRFFFAGENDRLASLFAELVRKYGFEARGSVVLSSRNAPNTTLPTG